VRCMHGVGISDDRAVGADYRRRGLRPVHFLGISDDRAVGADYRRRGLLPLLFLGLADDPGLCDEPGYTSVPWMHGVGISDVRKVCTERWKGMFL
jgi:hypothetical protein